MILNLPALVAASLVLAAPPKPAKLLGPVVLETSETAASVWARAEAGGPHTLYAWGPDGKPVVQVVRQLSADTDLCASWPISGLNPGRAYTYMIVAGEGHEQPPAPSDRGVSYLRTRPVPGTPEAGRLTLVFGSCDGDPFDLPHPQWTAIARERPDAVVLLGDTPYIDSTDLKVQRARYRGYLGVPELLALRRTTPVYATWDDHDFGKNDTDGRLEGKEHARRAFAEYHRGVSPSPEDGLGEGGAGIYRSVRMGPVELILLDTRWFAGTEASFADASKRTLLGAAQWAWLKRTLRASDAPFKLLCCGMVWNGAVRAGKPDHWAVYEHERKAVWAYIAEERISGVVLVGGDIHRSRAFRHETAFTGVPYPLFEITSSPLSQSVHVNPNAPHPGLLFDRGEPRSFVVLTVDATATPAVLRARWLSGAGEEFFALSATAAELTPP